MTAAEIDAHPYFSPDAKYFWTRRNGFMENENDEISDRNKFYALCRGLEIESYEELFNASVTEIYCFGVYVANLIKSKTKQLKHFQSEYEIHERAIADLKEEIKSLEFTLDNRNAEIERLKSEIRCRRCGGKMNSGSALKNTAVCGTPDFHGQKDLIGQTMSDSGQAETIEVLKCELCGYSRT